MVYFPERFFFVCVSVFSVFVLFLLLLFICYPRSTMNKRLSNLSLTFERPWNGN